jgi:hypothetical protein
MTVVHFPAVANFHRISIAVLAIFQAVVFDAAVMLSSALAQSSDFRERAKAPPAWEQFAKLVKYRFEEWVTGDDGAAIRFRAYLKIHRGASDGPPPSLIVKLWVNPDGSVERVSFPAFGDAVATRDLRTVLTRGNIGEAPPPEMLQPLVLRFSLPSE